MKNSILLFCLIFLFNSCEKDKASGSLTVSGYLTNGTSPVKNAKVDLDDLVQYKATSNSEGYFEINNVPEGDYKLNYGIGSENEGFSKISERFEQMVTCF